MFKYLVTPLSISIISTLVETVLAAVLFGECNTPASTGHRAPLPRPVRAVYQALLIIRNTATTVALLLLRSRGGDIIHRHRLLLIQRIKEEEVSRHPVGRQHQEFSASVVVVASLQMGALALVQTDILRRRGLRAIHPPMDILTDLHKACAFCLFG